MSCVKGVGTDILHLKTIAPSVRQTNDPFVRKVYTPRELELILSRNLPVYSFATRFAGKEAVFKAFGVHGDTFRLNDIEILEDDVGRPVVHLHGKAEKAAHALGIRQVLVSLSYDTDYAVAYAVALGE